MPINIKAVNDFGMDLANSAEGIACMTQVHGKAFYFPRTIVGTDYNPTTPTKIKAVIFPKYDPDASVTEITKPSYDDLVPSVLGSIVGLMPQSSYLSNFMHMVSTFEMKLISVRYADVELAAKEIVEQIDKW